MDRLSILVFSHLRWDWVYQRPQHLLARLAQHSRVHFVEEPVHDPQAGAGRWETHRPAPGVQVWRPYSPQAAPGFHAAQMPVLRPLVDELVARERLAGSVVWYYTPLALELGSGVQACAVVYDCMDELSGFRGAPPELVQREAELFAAADVVFTGGPSLHEAKRGRHPHVYCFPSSVDVAHFGQARGAATEPADQAGLPRPRLGFFGVVDERLDLALLDTVAQAHPDWQIVIVGPVTKISPQDLPRHANLHYFGQRSYEDLPRYLQGWDVCLLPFARNEATRFISPTKTLEYMAAEKPIVSTPIRDVVEPYGELVYAGATATEFVQACEAALTSSGEERALRCAGMRDVLARTSWDRTVAEMRERIGEAVARRAAAHGPPRPAARGPRPRVREHHPIVVVGGGPTGLSAAYHAADALLLERADRVGGWCRSLEVNGFTFDFAGHIMFSNEPYVHELYRRLLGGNVHWQDREAWIYSQGVYTRYPFQGALYGLPADVVKECLVGAIEARFGPLKAAPSGVPSGEGEAQCAPAVEDCCGDGVLESTATSRRGNGNGQGGDGRGSRRPAPRGGRTAGGPANFEEFIHRVWGAGIARHFAIPYNRKLWAVPLAEMETSWLGGRVPLPDLEEMIDGALRPVPKPMGPNARFGYPLRGGFQALMNGFLPRIGRRLRLNSEVTAVSPARQFVTVGGHGEVGYDYLISTMPLPRLVGAMGDEAPPGIRAAAAGLRHVSVRCVHIGVGRENLTEKHWIYYPEDTVFHRIFVQGNASPHCNPPGGFGLTCEITYSPDKPLPCEGDALIRRCIDDCVRVGFFRADDPIWAATQVDLPYAYVVYDHGRAARVRRIRAWLRERNILLAGRYGEWEYYNSDHAFVAGKRAVEAVRQLQVDAELGPVPAAASLNQGVR